MQLWVGRGPNGCTLYTLSSAWNSDVQLGKCWVVISKQKTHTHSRGKMVGPDAVFLVDWYCKWKKITSKINRETKGHLNLPLEIPAQVRKYSGFFQIIVWAINWQNYNNNHDDHVVLTAHLEFLLSNMVGCYCMWYLLWLIVKYKL